MIVRRERLFSEIVLFCDLLVIAISFLAASRVCAWYGPMDLGVWEAKNHLWLLWGSWPVWVVALRVFGLGASASYVSVRQVMGRMVRAQAISGTLLMALISTVNVPEIRLLPEAFIAISFVLLCAEKLAVMAGLIHLVKRSGSDRWCVLLVGSDTAARSYEKALKDYWYWGARVVGSIPLQPALSAVSSGNQALNREIATTPEYWHRILHNYVVDEVVALLTWQEATRTESLALACAERGITFRILVEMPPAPVGKYHVEDLDNGAYVLSLETVPQLTLALVAKRIIDIVGALFGLMLCGLAYVAYSWRIRRDSRGSVFFAQDRIGQNGRTFTMYKFRTMYEGAEKNLRELRSRNEMNGQMFKMKDDPRVTPLGRMLRRRHIDELPQFWNVLRGEMSLVGTRPPTPNEVAEYEARHYRRLSMRPGITGTWQLNGNAKVSDFEEVVKLDCEYIDQWSLMLDFKILGKTMLKVLHGSGW